VIAAERELVVIFADQQAEPLATSRHSIIAGNLALFANHIAPF